jgi:RimJ/RimL family protein N-acetyltransferase
MFARTPRLTLRPYWPEDAAELTKAIAHEGVAMKLARLPWPYRQQDAVAFLSLPRERDTPAFAILSHEGDYPRIIGGTGLHRDGGDHAIGYWLTPAAWGRGYATEAGHAMLGIARHALGLKRLGAWHFADNPASGRVLRKLGFRQIGRGTRPCLARGHDVDAVEFALDLDRRCGGQDEDEAGGIRMPMAA